MDMLKPVEQGRYVERSRDHRQVQVVGNLFGKGVDGAARGHDNRIVGLDQFDGFVGDTPLGFAVDTLFDVDIDVGRMGIHRAGTPVRTEQKFLFFQQLQVFSYGNGGYVQFAGDIQNLYKSLGIELVENVFVSFCNTEHIYYIMYLYDKYKIYLNKAQII